MNDKPPTHDELLAEVEELRTRLAEAQETLQAIRTGEVDALVAQGPQGEQIYTLKGAEEPYRVMVESMSEGAVTCSPDGMILYSNARFAELLKVPLEQTIGAALPQFIAVDERRTLEALLAQSLKGPARRVIGLHATDGTWKPMHFSTHPLKLNGAEAIAIVATDLSEVAAAVEARSRLALIVDSSEDAIISTSLDGVIDTWNAAAERLFGYTAPEAIGRQFPQLLVPVEHIGEATRSLETIRRDERIKPFETVQLRKDGTPADVSVTASPVKDAAGRIVGVSAILRDITERKRAEAALTKRVNELQAFFHLSELAVREDISLDDLYRELVSILPRSWQYPEIACARIVMGENEFHTGNFAVSNWMQAAPISIRGSVVGKIEIGYLEQRLEQDEGPFLKEERRLLDAIAERVGHITARRQAEEELRRYHIHLEHMVNQRTTQFEAVSMELEGFAYSISHDLRVPMRAIDGFSRMLLKRYENQLDEEGRRYLTLVRDNVQKMDLQFGSILALSRMGRQKMTLAEIDTGTLVREVFEELKPELAGRELALEIKALPPCRGDLAMLRQVWANLLGNAIKFTRPRTDAAVEVGGKTEGTEQIYYVRDNGAGFDMQYADKLFGIFQRLHGADEFEGSGVGLAIVRRIITRHGGRVWAEGKVNEGATFYFSLPLEEEKKK